MVFHQLGHYVFQCRANGVIAKVRLRRFFTSQKVLNDENLQECKDKKCRVNVMACVLAICKDE